MVYECEICGKPIRSISALYSHCRFKHDEMESYDEFKRSISSGDQVTRSRSGDQVTRSRSGDQVTTSRSGDQVTTSRSGDQVTTSSSHHQVTRSRPDDQVMRSPSGEPSGGSDEDEDCCLNCGADLEAIEDLGNGKYKVRCVECRSEFVWSD